MLKSLTHGFILTLALHISIISAAGRVKLGRNEDRGKFTEKIPKPTLKDKEVLERQLTINTDSSEEDDLITYLVELAQHTGVRASRASDKRLHERAVKVKRMLPEKPRPYGMDTKTLGPAHPMKSMRAGGATNTTKCHKVRPVPSELREDSELYLGVDLFYTKYTEAYGIPIIGSDDVTDHGLKRACYVVSVMLASRPDLRRSFRDFYNRIALIADSEQQTSLPEYSDWDPTYWNSRARGLGATIYLPVTSAGDDNQRCKAGERYFDQDILVHELAHGVEKVCHFVISQFKSRLEFLFLQYVVEAGLWAGTYASTNPREYFAVATQFFFDSFRGTSYRKLGVYDRNSLREYDPHITELLDEVFPCANRDSIIHRCQWKACDSSYFKLFLDERYAARSKCPVVKSSSTKATLDECAAYACYYQGNAFQRKDSVCEVLNCPHTESLAGFDIEQGPATYTIYRAVKIPKANLAAELNHDVKQGCVKNIKYDERCAPVLPEDKEVVEGLSRYECKVRSYCYDKGEKHCFKPIQDCVDRSLECPNLEAKGQCYINPGFLYRQCPFSCNVCQFVKSLPEGLLAGMCQDKNHYCSDWARGGQCEANPGYMLSHCKVSCGVCTPDLSLLGL